LGEDGVVIRSDFKPRFEPTITRIDAPDRGAISATSLTGCQWELAVDLPHPLVKWPQRGCSRGRHFKLRINP